MSIVLPGNSSSFVDFTAGSIAVNAPTQYFVAGRFRLLASIDEVGSGTIMRFGPANSGASISFAPQGSSTVFKLNSRLLVNGSSSTQSTANIPLTIGEWNEFMITADYAAGYIRQYVNNVLINEFLKAVPEDIWLWHSFATAAVIPRITGATTNGKHWEISDFVGRIGAVITPEDAADFSFETDDAADLTSPPTWGIKPIGAEGTYAGTLDDVYGSNNMTQVNGPVATNAGFPYLSGATDVLTAGAVESTARTVTVSGNTSVQDGTLFIVGDLAENWTGAPLDADIINGRLDDGSTPAAFVRQVDMLELSAFNEVFTVGLASSSFIFYLIQQTDGEGAVSNRMSLAVETKTPVVSPGGIWYDADGDTPLVSETNMTLRVLNSAYTQAGFSTTAEAEGAIDLTEYVNSGVALDIGDTLSFYLTRTNGQTLLVLNAVVAEAEGA